MCSSSVRSRACMTPPVRNKVKRGSSLFANFLMRFPCVLCQYLFGQGMGFVGKGLQDRQEVFHDLRG